MKINSIKISYSTTIPIMSYGVNDKIGVEMELSPSEYTILDGANTRTEHEQFNLEQLVSEHKANVDAIVKKLYPEKFVQGRYVDSYDAPPLNAPTLDESSQYTSVKDTPTMSEQIRSCKNLITLSIYEKIIDKMKDSEEKRKLWLIYDEVYAKLSNQTK